MVAHIARNPRRNAKYLNGSYTVLIGHICAGWGREEREGGGLWAHGVTCIITVVDVTVRVYIDAPDNGVTIFQACSPREKKIRLLVNNRKKLATNHFFSVSILSS